MFQLEKQRELSRLPGRAINYRNNVKRYST